MLYIIGFISLIGAILAYINRDQAQEPYQSHFNGQFSLFLRVLLYMAIGAVLYLVAMGITALTARAC
ncbi:hypothetical protein [Komagataeibacter xylinus]|uniref:Uncharacterized protein n=1 Tax=Komagataeibacter xylinus TaxID=28448 RepID=A0A857FPQ5_KOMXY|nr:hypothetical protein [Komagataeibacter xylinus]QHC36156.1 hypothetical protein FMA36_12195 [Komagataeibacter xylinus]